MNSKKYSWARWQVDGACDAGINSVVDRSTENIREFGEGFFGMIFGLLGLPMICTRTIFGAFEEALDENREELFSEAVAEFESHLETVRDSAYNDILETGEYVRYEDICEHGFVDSDEYRELEEEKEELEEKIEELENSVPHCPNCGEEMEFNNVQEVYTCTRCVRQFKFQEVSN